MNKKQIPVFIVTGAPNKGKSTFLKAMTNNPNIEVRETARTTVESKPYYFNRITSLGEKERLMTIWDTPGFENAAEVYEIIHAWKKETDAPPLDLIQRYTETYKDNPDHKFETEIFKPLTDFACIIYIADCSKSFSREDYLREIQLLKFTNLPRMAILNPIDGNRHLESWRVGLREYFHNIKVFNPHKTTFEEKLSTLGALSHLHDEWEKPINTVIEELKKERVQILEESARIIRSTILKIYDKEIDILFDGIKDENEHKKELAETARKFVQKKMNEAQIQITKKFGMAVEIELNQDFQDNDLFDESTVKSNLSPHQRGLIGAFAGGSIGVAIDVSAGGTTFGIPTLLGGGGGYFTGYLKGFNPEDLINFKRYLHSDKKIRVKIESLNIRMGFLVINRLRQVVGSLYNRTAANTEKVIIDKDLDISSLRKISGLLKKISESKKSRYAESNKMELLEFIHGKLIEDQRR